VRRDVVTNVNWLLTKSAAKLGDVGDRNMISETKSIFVESSMIVEQPNLDAISQQIVLAYQVLFLNAVVKLLILLF
jgi:hypothetical protein